MDLIDRALAEDVGEGDATTLATVAADARARATIRQKADGVISGLAVAEEVFRRVEVVDQSQQVPLVGAAAVVEDQQTPGRGCGGAFELRQRRHQEAEAAAVLFR